MLSFKERLTLLREHLKTTSPEELLNDLRSFERKGPIIEEFINYNQKILNSLKMKKFLNLDEHSRSIEIINIKSAHSSEAPSEFYVASNDENIGLAA